MLTTTEACAHLSIIDTVQLVIDSRLNDRYTLGATEPHLRKFRPRCNCGAVLRFSPWLDDLRVVKCEACGWKTLESPIRLELAAHARR